MDSLETMCIKFIVEEGIMRAISLRMYWWLKAGMDGRLEKKRLNVQNTSEVFFIGEIFAEMQIVKTQGSWWNWFRLDW